LSKPSHQKKPLATCWLAFEG